MKWPPGGETVRTYSRVSRSSSGAFSRSVPASSLPPFSSGFLNPEFLMEQYIRLVGARQILNGELPDQDFLNRGYTLMYYAAAAAMAVFGDGLLGDLVLTAGLVSFGAALTWFLSYRASSSVKVAGVAVLIAVSSYPALYNYPKVFLPVLGLFVVWRYIDHPSVGRLLAVSAAVVLALLFRHDHGLYLGLATVPMLACVHLPGDYKVFLQRALIVLVSVLAFGSPYILFLTANDRLVAHVRTSLWQSGSLVDAVQVTRTPFDIDLSQPLVRWVYDEAQVSVHWAEDVSDPVRQVMEERHQLRDGEFLGDRTWSYAIDGLSEQRLGALVGDPDIEDAHGIDRTAFRMPVVIAAGLRNEANATAWFYYATVSLPPLSLIVLGMKRFGWLSSQSALQCEAPKILTAAVYCLILHQALIRGSLDSRLADVSTPTAVLGAWLLGQALTQGAAPVVWERLHAVLRTGAVKMTWRKATGILLPLLMMLATLVSAWRYRVERHGIRADRAKVQDDRDSGGTAVRTAEGRCGRGRAQTRVARLVGAVRQRGIEGADPLRPRVYDRGGPAHVDVAGASAVFLLGASLCRRYVRISPGVAVVSGRPAADRRSLAESIGPDRHCRCRFLRPVHWSIRDRRSISCRALCAGRGIDVR